MSDPQTPESAKPEMSPEPYISLDPTTEPMAPHASLSSASEQPQTPVLPQPPKAKGGGGLASFALLVAIAGVGGVGYYVFQQQAEIARLSTELGAIQNGRDAGVAGVDAVRAAQTQLEQDLRAQLEQLQNAQATQLQQAQNQQSSQFENLNREISSLRTRVNEGGAAAGSTLRSNEAGALLRLAQERLVVARDVPAAIALMQGADDLLRQGNDSSAFAVREALAQDMAMLQDVEAVDTGGLYARLGAAAMRIGQLTVQPGGDVPTFLVEQPDATGAVKPWWQESLDYLERYFVITRDVADAVPVLGADQTWMIEERLRLQLEAARIAVLQGEVNVYQGALDDVITGIDQLTQGEDKPALLTELRSLRGSPIQTAIPPATRALDALRSLQPAERQTP